jgi:type IV pilus assembly protein PilM
MKKNLLINFFGIPNYLSMPAVGIEISNRSIKYVEFTKRYGVLNLEDFGEASISSGIIENGSIIKKDDLIKILSDLKTNFSSNFVRLSIPEEKVYIFNTKIPSMKDSEIRQALEFRIEENVPLKLDEVIFEYDILGKEGGEILLNVFVVSKEIILGYTDVLILSGLCPVAFDVESIVVAKTIIEDKKNSIILNIKEDSSILSAVIHGVVHSTLIIPVGESLVKEGLSKVKSIKNLDFNKSGLFYSPEISLNTDVSDALLNVFSIFKDEVEKFNDFYISQTKDKISGFNGFDSIILCGKSAILSGFTKHINQDLNIKVEVANPWIHVFDVNDKIPSLKFEESLGYISAIGSSLMSYLK